MADDEYRRLTCSVSACDGVHKAHGYCLRHYRQHQRGGITQDATHCARCGRQITGERGKTYCSGRCKLAAWKAANPERHKALPSNQRKVCAVYAGYCEQCGAAFVSKFQRAYCDERCKPRPQYAPRQPTLRTCKRCGAGFVPHERVTRPTDYCGAECWQAVKRQRKKIEKAQRRARVSGVRSERVDPLKVFERDRWRCRLCGVATPKTLRGTCNDRAPELDHILPLAAGGEHTYRNTQCACRRCNRLKGTKPLGQLLLIG